MKMEDEDEDKRKRLQQQATKRNQKIKLRGLQRENRGGFMGTFLYCISTYYRYRIIPFFLLLLLTVQTGHTTLHSPSPTPSREEESTLGSSLSSLKDPAIVITEAMQPSQITV